MPRVPSWRMVLWELSVGYFARNPTIWISTFPPRRRRVAFIALTAPYISTNFTGRSPGIVVPLIGRTLMASTPHFTNKRPLRMTYKFTRRRSNMGRHLVCPIRVCSVVLVPQLRSRSRCSSVIGYGFGDEHVNAIIRQALAIPSFSLVVVDPAPKSDFVSHLNQLGDERVWLVGGWRLGTFEHFVERLLPDLQEEEITAKVMKTYKALGVAEQPDDVVPENPGDD